MKHDNHLKMEFASLAENVSLARVVVASFVAQSDITISELEEIKVAVSEAVSNAIIHGYGNRPHQKVIIELTRVKTEVTISVQDFGVGIADIEQAIKPSYSSDPDRMGLGFVFMKSFMDDLQVQSQEGQGTLVIMKKKLTLGKPCLEKDAHGQA